MLRTVEHVKVSDRISTQSLLEKNNMLSVNQMMAQIKVTEMWKAINTTNNPLHFQARETPLNGRITRSNTNGMLENTGCSEPLTKYIHRRFKKTIEDSI